MNAYPTMTPALLNQGAVTRATRQTLDYMTSARGRRVLYLLLAVWILNAFDLSLTIQAQADGMLHEGNPLARAILSRGAGAIFAFKIILVTGASYVIYSFRHHRCTEAAVTFILLAYVGVALQWHLCYEMYEIAHMGNQCPADFARVDALFQCFPVF